MSIMTIIRNIFGGKSKTPPLSPGDRMLKCEDCQNDFVFDAGEQRFFKSKGFTDPKRCIQCRKMMKFRLRKKRRNGNGNGRSHHRPRKFHHRYREDSPYADEP